MTNLDWLLVAIPLCALLAATVVIAIVLYTESLIGRSPRDVWDRLRDKR